MPVWQMGMAIWTNGVPVWQIMGGGWAVTCPSPALPAGEGGAFDRVSRASGNETAAQGRSDGYGGDGVGDDRAGCADEAAAQGRSDGYGGPHRAAVTATEV